MDSSDQLISLLRRCTVRLSVSSESGTGFFVAPGLILTCTHVVGDIYSDQTTITVQWGDQTYHAKIMRMLPSPYPDLALLELEDVLATHPCVLLNDAMRVDDTLYSYGYTKNYSHGEPATFVFEGMTGEPKLLKFKEGEAVFGFSGAPLLNRRTGCVCGMMSITRGQNTLLGGRGIPTSVVLEKFEELVTPQKEFHDKDRHWYDLLPESEVKKFSWQEMRDICSKITENRMATVRDKYREELYLQRNHAHQAFMRFLEDPTKRGFVLIGGSGVGKSNFLLAAREELQSRKDVCMLIYDAASSMEHSLMETIEEDFHEQLGWTTQRLWEKIKNIDGIDKRLVLICVDTLNEHEQARTLLKQLNELIQKPWSWLKVVIVSRPEAWQFIKHRVKLAEALYYRGEGETPGAILESFNYSDYLEPFSCQELPLVYARYQRLYQVQTPYEDLSSRIRDIISDPFNLWLATKERKNSENVKTTSLIDRLVTKASKNAENVKGATLIEEYLSALAEEGKLQGGDREWLEHQLVPLMVSERHYERVITSEELDTADHALYLALLDRVDHSGQPQLQSFKNMVDADILKREADGLGFKISFKYERFYDFFIGRRIFHLSKAQADRYGFFLSLIGEITQKYYLWGAVKNALLQEIKEYGPEVVLKLCFTEQQRIKEMMVSVLTDLGLDLPLPQVENMLRNLISPEKKATEAQKARQLLGKSTIVAASKPRVNASKIAIVVACKLKLPKILKAAALQADPSIRTNAVRYTYYLWQRDTDKGFEILDHLAEDATRGLLPNRMSLEAALGLSLLIFFEHYHDELVLPRLQATWHKIIDKLLFIGKSHSLRERMIQASFVRERLLSLFVAVLLQYAHDLPAYNVILSEELESFFRLGTAEKALYRNLVHYLDVNGNYSREQMEHDYLEVVKINNLLISYVVMMGLIAQTCSTRLAFLPFLKTLFEEAKNSPVRTPSLTDITNVAENLVACNPTSDELFDFFVYTFHVCQDYYVRCPQALHDPVNHVPEAGYLGPYILYHYQRTGTARTNWLEGHIRNALEQKNLRFFGLLLAGELPNVGILQQNPKAALDALALFFNSNDPDVRQLIQSFLARLRVHYPDEVDDFLEEQRTSDAYRIQIRTSEPAETIGDLIGLRSWYFLRDDVLMKSPELRSLLMSVFEKAAGYTNLRAWLNIFIHEIIDLVYGGEALRRPK